MKINLTNTKPRKMNQKIFTITLPLEPKLKINAIGIKTVKNLLDSFLIWKNNKL